MQIIIRCRACRGRLQQDAIICSFCGRNVVAFQKEYKDNEAQGTWASPTIATGYIDSVEVESDTPLGITKKYYHDPIFFSLVGNLDEIKTLDVGCGNFYMSYLLKKDHPSSLFFATDIPEMIDAAIQKYKQNRQRDILDAVRVKACYAYDLQFENEKFDLVTASMMLHWIDKAKESIAEMCRVLKKGGLCVVSTVHPDIFHAGRFIGMDEPIPTFVQDVDTKTYGEYRVFLGDNIGPLVYYLRPVLMYKTLFEKAGFSKVNILEPTFRNQEVINNHVFMKKYINYPNYLFIQAIK